MFPRTTVEFFLKAEQADTIITKDQQGQVTVKTLRQAEMSTKGKKKK